jgi:hypothetical protein
MKSRQHDSIEMTRRANCCTESVAQHFVFVTDVISRQGAFIHEFINYKLHTYPRIESICQHLIREVH